MSKEMEFFTFLMEQYAHYKNTTADKILRQLDELNLTDYDSSYLKEFISIENQIDS